MSRNDNGPDGTVVNPTLLLPQAQQPAQEGESKSELQWVEDALEHLVLQLTVWHCATCALSNQLL